MSDSELDLLKQQRAFLDAQIANFEKAPTQVTTVPVVSEPVMTILPVPEPLAPTPAAPIPQAPGGLILSPREGALVLAFMLDPDAPRYQEVQQAFLALLQRLREFVG